MRPGGSGLHLCRRGDVAVTTFLQIGVGTGRKVLVVGESLAPHGWRESGKAFYTRDGRLLPSGRNLDRLLEWLDLRLESVSFTDLVKCYVGERRELLEECARGCWPLFIRQLRSYRFKLIVLLGVSTSGICARLANCKLQMGRLSSLRIGRAVYPVLALYHPSPVNPRNRMRNERIMRRVAPEVRRLLR